MPNQPSKESLKLATAFFIGYFGNNAEKYHSSGIETLAFVFDDEAKDLRQQNAALVSALRWALENLSAEVSWGGPFDEAHPQGEYVCNHCGFSWLPNGEGTENHSSSCGLLRIRQALALYAPAKAEAKEKP